MSTLQTIRANLLVLLNEEATGGHFTTSELNSLLNQAQTFSAVLAEYPRDHIDIQVEVDTPVYTLLTDTLKIMQAYFGNASISGDMKKLRILDENKMAEIRPNWMESDTRNSGAPDTVMLLDRRSIFLSPPPDTVNSASGKKLLLTYIYYPANMTLDSDSPDLPPAWHDLIPIYAAHLAYMGRLNNPTLAVTLKNDFLQKVKLIIQPTTQEIYQMSWGFGSEGPASDNPYRMIP